MNLDMTLREFFELSERMAAAARVIRESQAALGAPQWGPGPAVIAHEEARAAEKTVAAITRGEPVVQWSPEEQAIRSRLKAEREATAKKLEEVVLESRQ